MADRVTVAIRAYQRVFIKRCSSRRVSALRQCHVYFQKSVFIIIVSSIAYKQAYTRWTYETDNNLDLNNNIPQNKVEHESDISVWNFTSLLTSTVFPG